MIVTKGLGSGLLITQGYGAGILARIKRLVVILYSEFNRLVKLKSEF